MSITLGKLTDANNVRVLDAIRNDASLDYQNRVPSASKAGVKAVVSQLTRYNPLFNEFESSLINRIGTTVVRNKVWTNPLSEFKQGLLEFGSTIQEIQIGLLKAHSLNTDADYGERALFGRELPEVQTNYHTVNRRDFYRVTTNEDLLRQAFVNEHGLVQYIDDVLSAPVTSDNWDEFLLTTQLFAEYERNGGFFHVNVPDLSDVMAQGATADADAKTALRIIRSLVEKFKFISTTYNAAKMPIAADPSELILFTTPEFRSGIDVNALAAAFNLDHANIPTRIISIPQEYFGIDGCQAILTTEEFFVIADQKLETTSQFNPASTSTNHFLHHWEVISASRFVPAVMLTTKAGDDVIKLATKLTAINAVKAYDVDDKATTTVVKGNLYRLDATVTTDPADSTAIMPIEWSVKGAESTMTRVNQSGGLYVAPDETAAKLTVTAIDASLNGDKPRDAAISKSADLTVSAAEPVVPEWPVEHEEDTPPVGP